MRGIEKYVDERKEAQLLVLGEVLDSPANWISDKLRSLFLIGWIDDEGRKRAQYFFELSIAWDALAYNSFPPHSGAAFDSRTYLSMYSDRGTITSVKLSSPDQGKLLAACAEVASVPYKGQTEIPIPEGILSRYKGGRLV